MTYNDIYLKNRIVANIPLVFEGRKLPKSEVASVMLARIAYDKRVQEFEEIKKEIEKGLKKEGFSTGLPSSPFWPFFHSLAAFTRASKKILRRK